MMRKNFVVPSRVYLGGTLTSREPTITTNVNHGAMFPHRSRVLKDNPECLDVLTCLGVNPLDMPRTPLLGE